MSLEEFKNKTWQTPVAKDISQEQLQRLIDILDIDDFQTVIIVNTASECGFTRQYADLQKFYNDNKDNGLLVVAQPSNNFGQQEPGEDNEIKEFCNTTFGVTFPILPKADVVNENSTELYNLLAEITGQRPMWNFHKYIISKKLNKLISTNHFNEIDERFINDVKATL